MNNLQFFVLLNFGAFLVTSAFYMIYFGPLFGLVTGAIGTAIFGFFYNRFGKSPAPMEVEGQ